MNFVVTARKWRPQIFADVVGQEHITKTLKNAIINNRIAHAFIFAGPRGVGKTTTARILAKSLNCLNPKDGEPCNSCDMCKSFQSSQSLDIIEIDGASNRRIEEIRALRESVKYAPSKGKFKIYIIDEVHMLTPESFNALLKTLEEPPPHTIFVFATTDIHKVPLTIISRCQRFDFRRIELDAIKNQLKSIADAEKIKIDDKSLTLIAKKADGALRDAQSLFDQVISFCGTDINSQSIFQMLNLIDEDIYFELSDAIIQKTFVQAFEISNKVYENGWNYIDFVNGLIEHFRNILTVVITGGYKLIESAEIYKNKYLDYKNQFSEGDLLRILAFLNTTLTELKNTQNHKLKTEISLSHLIGLERTSTISAILSKFDTGGSGGENSSQKKINSNLFSKPASKSEIDKEPDLKANDINLSSPSIEKNNKKFEMPNVSLHTDLDSLISQWSDFLNYVEKDFSFGPLLSNSLPVRLNNSKLEIAINNQEDIEHLKNSKPKLDSRIKEFFGKKVDIDFVVDSNRNIVKENKEEFIPNNSLSRAIIEQLGGKEVR